MTLNDELSLTTSKLYRHFIVRNFMVLKGRGPDDQEVDVLLGARDLALIAVAIDPYNAAYDIDPEDRVRLIQNHRPHTPGAYEQIV